MSALDSAFLQLEDDHSSLHIGSIAVFEGPAPAYDEIRTALRRKLPLAPRYRQRLRLVPGNLGRPIWVDDPEFDLDYHLRRTAVPEPGGDRELQDLVGRIMSQPLDHDRPLWEDWVVEGLDHGRWGLVTKIHHSMVDGIAGTDLLTTMLDKSRVPDPVPDDDFSPAPLPGRTALLAQVARQRLGSRAVGLRGSMAALRHPQDLVRRTAATTAGLLRFAGAAWPIGSSSLHGDLGRQRRYRWAEVPIADLVQVREALGGSFNDVVLAAVTLGFQDLLLARGEGVGRHTVRTLVPVSVRRPDERGHWDNRVSAILLDLPVDVGDPREVLSTVSGRMDRLKGSHEAEAGEVVTGLADLLPPPGLAAGLHLAFRFPQWVLTTVITNVPGPRTDLYLAGRRMLATYPYVPIADRVRVGVAVTSYAGSLLFGITADWQSTPDIDVLRDGIVQGFHDLKVKAEQEGAGV